MRPRRALAGVAALAVVGCRAAPDAVEPPWQWRVPVPGAIAPGAAVVDGAAAWRREAARLQVSPAIAPPAWRDFQGGRRFVVVAAPGTRFGAPEQANEEGVTVFTLVAQAAPTSVATATGAQVPPGTGRLVIVVRSAANDAVGEQVLWVDPVGAR